MSGSYRALFLIAVAAIVALALSADQVVADNTDPIVEERTFYGYVTNLSDQEENTPLEDVTVTLFEDDGTGKKTVSTGTNPCRTDSSGMFEFTFTYDSTHEYYLTFNYPGYTVRALPDSMNMDSDGYVHFELTADMLGEDGRYGLTETADSLHAIVMVITTGSVYGVVRGDNDGNVFELGRATVTIVSENGQSFSTQTDSSGYFIIECPYGTYDLFVRCNGFQDSEPISVESGQNTAYTIVLTQNTSNIFGSVDSAHATMIVALLIFALLILTVIGVQMRVRRGGKDEVFVNDLEDLTDDEDVRHP